MPSIAHKQYFKNEKQIYISFLSLMFIAIKEIV